MEKCVLCGKPTTNPLHSFLKSFDEVISHYDFVMADISSEIYNN